MEQPTTAELPTFSVLGVRIHHMTRQAAIAKLEEIIRCRDARTAAVFFANAHALNLAASDPAYRETLNSADFVFPDGTGVRWAARLQGVRVVENMPGTDFVPEMFLATADRGHSYFLLGADEETVAAAADYAQKTFPGWRLTGSHHGYLADATLDAAVVDRINTARPDVLLVGMGNPRQEHWIADHQSQLQVPLVFGVGGLFDFWAGNVSRSPAWLRRMGHEWLWRLFQAPGQKARRYLVGNPLFLARILRERCGARKNRGNFSDGGSVS